MAWYVAPCLQVLRDEINALNPNRDKTSDGAVGDVSHSARVSDHNPAWSAGGVVRARDFDEDGIDAWAVVRAIARDPRLSYLIYEGQIGVRSATTGVVSWRRYSGPNPHDHHFHVSIRHGKTWENDTSPWGVATKGSNIMATLDNDDLVAILNAQFQITQDGKVRTISVKEALGAVVYYGDVLTKAVAATPSGVWGHGLVHPLSGKNVPAGDLQRFEAAEHANTRAFTGGVVTALPGADVEAITAVVQDALAKGVKVNVSFGDPQ